MKIIVALLFCFVGVHTNNNATNHDNTDSDMITCLIDYGLDPSGIYNHRKFGTKLPTEDQKNCYLACMLKKIRYMNEDGTINIELILTNTYGPEKRAEGIQKIEEIVNTCKLQAGKDICKLARCFHDLRKTSN